LTYFDLFQSYPIVKTSSKRDSFLKLSETSEIQIISNEDLENTLKDYKNIY
jgi:hypothetical protein